MKCIQLCPKKSMHHFEVQATIINDMMIRCKGAPLKHQTSHTKHIKPYKKEPFLKMLTMLKNHITTSWSASYQKVQPKKEAWCWGSSSCLTLERDLLFKILRLVLYCPSNWKNWKRRADVTGGFHLESTLGAMSQNYHYKCIVTTTIHSKGVEPAMLHSYYIKHKWQ